MRVFAKVLRGCIAENVSEGYHLISSGTYVEIIERKDYGHSKGYDVLGQTYFGELLLQNIRITDLDILTEESMSAATAAKEIINNALQHARKE